MNLSLNELAALRIAAKEREEAAVAHRREIDAAIVESMAGIAEGSVTKEAGDYKINVVFKMDRKLDTTALQSAWQALPPAAQESVKWKADLSVTEYRKLSEDDRAKLDTFITSKPATPAVKVESITKEQ